MDGREVDPRLGAMWPWVNPAILASPPIISGWYVWEGNYYLWFPGSDKPGG